MSKFSLSLLLKRGKNNLLKLLLKKKLSDDPSNKPGENALTPNADLLKRVTTILQTLPSLENDDKYQLYELRIK